MTITLFVHGEAVGAADVPTVPRIGEMVSWVPQGEKLRHARKFRVVDVVHLVQEERDMDSVMIAVHGVER